MASEKKTKKIKKSIIPVEGATTPVTPPLEPETTAPSAKSKTKPATPPATKTKKSLGKADVIALGLFGLLVVAVGGASLWITRGKATVTIQTSTLMIPATSTATLNIDDEPSLDTTALHALNTPRDFTVSKTYEMDGDIKEPARPTVTVTLKNESSRDYQLAINTRLLSEDGKQYRTNARVNIASGDETTVTAIADNAGLSAEVGPTRWTIPGLPGAAQTLMYGVSTTSAVGGEVSSGIITDELIAEKKAALFQLEEQTLADSLEANGRTQIAGFWAEERDLKVEPEVGSTTKTYTITVSGTLHMLTLDRSSFDQVISKSMAHDADLLTVKAKDAHGANLPPAGYSFASYDPSSLTMDITNFDPNIFKASATLSYDAIFTPHDLDITKLARSITGKNPEAAKAALLEYPGVVNPLINLPRWSRTLPTSASRINILIAE